MKRWFVSTFYHGYLKKLEAAINKRKEFKDVKMWYPYTYKIVVKDCKKQRVQTPMFDNYVLFEYEEDSLVWKDIIRLTPIMGFLKSSGSGINSPIALTDDEVEQIRFLEVKETITDYKQVIGKRVIITDGPFEGFVGDCKAIIKNHNTARIIIDMFGINSKSVEVSLENIKPI
jgi:transcription antitermination factor NusG